MKYVLIAFFNGMITNVQVFSSLEKVSAEFMALTGFSYDEYDEYISSTFDPSFCEDNTYLCFETMEV